MEEDELDEEWNDYYGHMVTEQLVNQMVFVTKSVLCLVMLMLVNDVLQEPLYYLVYPVPASRGGRGLFQAALSTLFILAWYALNLIAWWRVWRALDNPVRKCVTKVASYVSRDGSEDY